MKKQWLSVVLLIGLFLLVGCSSQKQETKAFLLNQNGISIQLVYTYKGDKVIEQTANNVLPYKTIGVETKEDAQAILNPTVLQYQGLKGVDHQIKYTDNEAVETLTVNYDELDFDEAESVPGITIQGDTAKGVSMKKTEEMLIKQGYTVQE